MDYKDLMQRYWQAETSVAEEQELREHLSAKETPNTEERIVRAMMHHAVNKKQSVNIRLHQSKSNYWQIALAAGLCSLAVLLTIKLNQPTIYGYYNGEPITTLAEAQYHADKIFSNLAQVELPTEEELMQKLFLLNE